MINGCQNHDLRIYGFTYPTACFATSAFFNAHITGSDIAHGLTPIPLSHLPELHDS